MHTCEKIFSCSLLCPISYSSSPEHDDKNIDYQQIQHIEHRYYTSDIGLAFHCPGVRKNLDKIEFCMLNKNFENFCVDCS